MIFAKTLDKLVVQKKKTQTRRPKKDGEYCVRDEDGNIIAVYTASGRLKYKVGNDYAIVPGRGKHGIKSHRILMQRIREEAFGEISEQDAIAEGFSSRDEFFAIWRELYGDWQPDLWAYDIDTIEK